MYGEFAGANLCDGVGESLQVVHFLSRALFAAYGAVMWIKKVFGPLLQKSHHSV